MNDGPMIPGYPLTRRLGGGSMAAVFAATSEATGEPCAVKVLHPDWEADAMAVTLIRREARVGLAVHHSRIARMFDAHVFESPYFVVMELLEGETVRDRLRRDYAVDVGSCIWITRQMAEALHTLHRAGFVHGDIKPDNIRLIEHGQAKLIDLGFAHRPGENASWIAEGYVMGTANYLAPEMCEPTPSDTGSADVFALGVTVFEMLTGVLPYPNGPTQETMIRHRDESAASLADMPGDWDDALVDIVDAMLQRDPKQRIRPAALVQRLIELEITTRFRRAG